MFARALLSLLLAASSLSAAVTARYIRVENPTGVVMEFKGIEVWSGGTNVVLKHPEMVSGTITALQENTAPTRENTILRGVRAAVDLTNGSTDVSQRAGAWNAFTDPKTKVNSLNPWFEVDLGRPMAIEKIVLYASRYPSKLYLDKGHRVISALGADRKVVWADKWQYYESTSTPKGVFTFTPTEGGALAGTLVPEHAPDWVAMGWLLNADASRPPADAEKRRRVFAKRNSPAQVEAFAREFFPLLDSTVPELAEAFRLYTAGQYQAALEAWKTYWFAKMARLNRHVALHESVTYRASGDDLLQGLLTTITDREARAIHYTPGEIHWIDLPDDPAKRAAAMADSERLAQVDQCCWPLLSAFRETPKPAYLQRWAEIMDDWSLNFFADAAASPYEVENLFTFSPGNAFGTMMEDLSDLAVARPETVRLIPALTLARVQLLCLEKYSTAWWRQARETVFNHNNGGLYTWACLTPYLQEFHAGQRAEREVRQGYERWFTLGTEPDGSMTEIGDDGHMEMPVQQGYIFSMWDKYPPAWWTPGWRNRALTWHDNTFKYMLRHLAPGGYEHRFAVGYRPQRWTSTWEQYLTERPVFRPINRDAEVFGIPEVRRMLGAWGHLSTPAASLREPQRKAQEAIMALLAGEKPEAPHILSDWMPYTGAYYFRSGWNDDDAFLAMMACGSHGGSQAPQWPFGMIYLYDHDFPLVAAQPVQVDGLPPQQLYGRMNAYEPGTKTMALTQADEKPEPNRWLSNDRFDFGEATFQGAYQRFPSFKGDYGGPDLAQQDPGKAVADVRSMRQIIYIRALRIFIVTDAIETPGEEKHQFSVPWRVSLSALQRNPTQPFGPEELVIDEKAGLVHSENPDGPSVTLGQVANLPLRLVRGPEAPVDTKKYGPRLTDQYGVAEQLVTTQAEGNHLTLVSVIVSRERGAEERVASFETNNGKGLAGFHLALKGGTEVWYQSAGLNKAPLACGPDVATGQALLVTREGKAKKNGIALDAEGVAVAVLQFPSSNGKMATYVQDRFESPRTEPPERNFDFRGFGTRARILRPIDPVSFRPNRNTFETEERVEMASQTPGVEIRYTTDGTPPTRTSRLYQGAITITEGTTFAARAFRPGAADDFEINGTHFTEPTWGWFTKAPAHPALAVEPAALEPGLQYDVLDAPWWRLYSEAHWLPAIRHGTAAREMDLSEIASTEPYGVRYRGFLKIPRDSLYTFHARPSS